MSFFSTHAKSNDQLIEGLKRGNILRSKRVELAMKEVDRKFYCDNFPYDDSPQYIGCGQTISAPHMHVICLEELEPHLKPGSKVLDVGTFFLDNKILRRFRLRNIFRLLWKVSRQRGKGRFFPAFFEHPPGLWHRYLGEIGDPIARACQERKFGTFGDGHI